MPKWNPTLVGPVWLMDEIGRLIGYRDRRGGEFRLQQAQGAWGDAEAKSVPDLTNIQRIRAKFFASLPNGTNYRSGKSILAAPAWSAGVLVMSGYVCQNAGNLYAAVRVADVNTNGLTTTAGNAPTGTGAAPIIGSDNIPWLYAGVADTALPDSSDLPAISHATVPAACTTAVTTANTPSGWSAGSGGSLDPYNISSYWFSGSDFAWASGAGGGVNGIAAVNYTSSAAVEFLTDSPLIAIGKIQKYAGADYSPMVNGYPLSPKSGQSYPFSAFNTIPFGSLVFDWTAKPNKVRRVRLATTNKTFSGVWLPPQYNVWAPVNPNRYRLYLEGDSFTQGGSSGNGYLNTICHRVGMMLGCDDVWSSAVGGGGFIKLSNNGDTILSRAPKVIAAAPDILFCMATDWDVFYTSAQRRAAYTQYFTTLLAALPDLIIIACGGRGVPNYVSAAGSYNVDADMAAAISALNHPHVVYVDATAGMSAAFAAGGLTVAQTITLGLNRMWFSGTGTAVGSLDADAFTYNIAGSQAWGTGSQLAGGASQDGHPNVRGLEVMQWQIYNAIVRVMNNIKD